MRSIVIIAGVAAILGFVAESSAQVDAGAWGDASVQEQLAELEQTRKELEQLTQQLDEQRVELERGTERARSRRHLQFVAGGVGVLIVIVAGVAWLTRRRKKSDAG